MDGMLTV
jgi:hypothetical protein